MPAAAGREGAVNFVDTIVRADSAKRQSRIHSYNFNLIQTADKVAGYHTDTALHVEH